VWIYKQFHLLAQEKTARIVTRKLVKARAPNACAPSGMSY